MKLLGYTVVIERDEKNTWHGYVPALLGCHTWGDSEADTVTKLQEAIGLYLEELQSTAQKLPIDNPFRRLTLVPN